MGAVAYEQDFHQWALQQAELLHKAAFEKLDVTHLIEELQAMSARERRELISRQSLPDGGTRSRARIRAFPQSVPNRMPVDI